MDIFIITLKLALGFIIILLIMRLLGKRNLAQLNAGDVIYLLVFGGILEESIYDISEIKNMYVESDGGFSIEKYNTAYPLKEYDYQIYELIKNNEINTDTLKHINHDEHWLFKQLEKRQITTINDVFYADWSFDRGIHIIKYR